MDAITNVPAPYNEPIGTFAPGTPERAGLEQGLKDLVATTHELPNVIGGKKVMATGEKIEVRSPHEHSRV
ncbi:MAG: 1-pyrroline-5-carboxylate dehydrogenase, partial [Actinobacteria bacterium]|nr:1-pyrroline-5-carboxylate dehydrogenase [Actinomycetota bacterium]